MSPVVPLVAYVVGLLLGAWGVYLSMRARRREGDFYHLARGHREWSERQFGTAGERGPEGSILHLEREIHEILAAPCDPEEYADALLLLLDASWRAGIDAEDLVMAARLKHAKNLRRTWPRPTPDRPVEHVR